MKVHSCSSTEHYYSKPFSPQYRALHRWLLPSKVRKVASSNYIMSICVVCLLCKWLLFASGLAVAIVISTELLEEHASWEVEKNDRCSRLVNYWIRLWAGWSMICPLSSQCSPESCGGDGRGEAVPSLRLSRWAAYHGLHLWPLPQVLPAGKGTYVVILHGSSHSPSLAACLLEYELNAYWLNIEFCIFKTGLSLNVNFLSWVWSSSKVLPFFFIVGDAVSTSS